MTHDEIAIAHLRHDIKLWREVAHVATHALAAEYQRALKAERALADCRCDIKWRGAGVPIEESE